MRVPVALIAAALFVGAPEIRAEQAAAFGGLRLAPEGAGRASENAGKRNPYSRLFEHGGRAKNASPVPAPDVSASDRREGAARANENAGKRNPYSRLFEYGGRAKNANPVPAPDVSASDRRIEQPVVKCGMTLIPGDPRIETIGNISRV